MLLFENILWSKRRKIPDFNKNVERKIALQLEKYILQCANPGNEMLLNEHSLIF